MDSTLARVVIWVALVAAASLCALQPCAHAGPVMSETLPMQIQQADLICVGRISQVRPLDHQAVWPTGISDAHGPINLTVPTSVAALTVERIFKGAPAARHILASFPTPQRVLPGWAEGDVQGFRVPALTAGERVLVFMCFARQKPGETLRLLDPFSVPGPVVAFSANSRLPEPRDLSRLRQILLCLVGQVHSGPASQQVQTLARIGSVKSLLYNWVGVSRSNEEITAQRLAVQEPPTLNLEIFVQTAINPLLTDLMSSPDLSVRKQAILTLGNLQDPGAVPGLAAMAHQEHEASEALWTLSAIRSPDSVRPLIQLLSDQNAGIRQSAARSLLNIGDRLALPFLLDDLDDPDKDARAIVVSALFTIAMPNPPPLESDQDPAISYVAFWKQWGIDHLGALQALRSHYYWDMQ